MATHSSTLAWQIPWTEKPGRLQSMESLRDVPCPPKTSACTVLQISSHLLRVSSIILPSFSTHIHSANIYRATLYLDAGVIMANELDIVSYELDLIKLPL